MLSRLYSLFNSSSLWIKYTSIFSVVSFLLFIAYYFLDPEIKVVIDAFIIRVLFYSKTQIIFILKLLIKKVLFFFWGVFVMQFWYGFVYGGIKKFFLMSFGSKVFLLSISLGKRYIIDNVIMVSINKNFIYHIKRPILNLIFHYKEIIKDFSLKKKIAVWAAAVGIPFIIIAPILYFVGLFTFILEKVFSANMWKAMLIWLLKVAGVFLTFFSNVWDSWFAPLIEIVIFTWILGILEKIPVVNKLIRPVYVFFNRFMKRAKRFFNRHLHSNIKKGFGKAINHINYHVDITILKSQNEKMLDSFTPKRRKAIKKYFKNTTKLSRVYSYNKRMNAYFLNKNTQNRKYFGTINERRKLKVKNNEFKVRSKQQRVYY